MISGLRPLSGRLSGRRLVLRPRVQYCGIHVRARETSLGMELQMLTVNSMMEEVECQISGFPQVASPRNLWMDKRVRLP